MYFIPLGVICFAYICILWEIYKKTRETRNIGEGREDERQRSGRLRLRRSDMSNIERARERTLKMTITIVVAFIWCWTPYVVMTLWYMFDRESAEKVDTRLQDLLFIMAVSNSCVNPLVYGSYAMNFKKECRYCCRCFFPQDPNYTRKSIVSGVTRSTATTAGVLTPTVPQRNVIRVTPQEHRRPLSEHALSEHLRASNDNMVTEEFHSYPGHGVYLVPS